MHAGCANCSTLSMEALDHIVLAAETLEEGANYVQGRLGVGLEAGGEHSLFGTHNRLLGLGDCYFEVIARNPLAAPAKRSLWFELEKFSGPPRVITWVCQTSDMARALSALPYNPGPAIAVNREDLIWDLTIAEDGRLAMDGAAPSIIDWKNIASPTQRLPDAGCRLKHMTVSHTNAAQLAEWAERRLQDMRITFKYAEEPKITLTLTTPNGDVDLW